MNTLEKLMEKLTVSESPGLEAFDERFGAIGDHAQARRFGQAAELFEQLIDDDIYDFRLAVYYLYHCIDTEQAEGVQAVLKTLNAVFEQNWEAWGPSNNREKVFAKSLAWLFQNSNDLISYHAAAKDSTWGLFKARDEQLLDGLRDEFLALSKRLEGPVWSSCGGHLATLQRSLESEYSLLDAAVVAEPEADVDVEEPVAVESSEDVPVLKKTSEDAVELKASPQFFQLQQKLRAFEVLIEKGQYEKAAVVSNDLMALINDFDPRQYFPDLFAGFFGALNRSIQEVRPHLENRDPMTWDTLEQFYKVDLEGFVKD